MTNTNAPKTPEKRNLQPIVSTILPDGSIVEMVLDSQQQKTSFVVWNGTDWNKVPRVVAGEQVYIPYAASNNLLRHGVVFLPSEPVEYGDTAMLVAEIRSYIHALVDVSPVYEHVATYYVLLSWIYDGFNELPYLRLRGDAGSGKTRFLLAVGALCYKPIFASGASTISPLFRILDSFRGTLIIDEGDFRMSDERAEIIKILNNGNARGFSVLRSEVTNQREYDPRAYSVFGPKLIATRDNFADRALESRCLTEDMGQRRLRTDIPINLDESYREAALGLRNKLLLFRFRNLHSCAVDEQLMDPALEPRLNQMFLPLLSIIDDPTVRADIQQLARTLQQELILDRGTDTEAQVLEVIRDLHASGATQAGVKDIAEWFSDRFGSEYERSITPKWIGGIIRRKLRIKTYKSHGVYLIDPSEHSKLRRLYERYGLVDRTSEERVRDFPAEKVAFE